MMRIVIIILLFAPLMGLAQKNYPYAILPGQEQVVKHEVDTLWVLKHSQMQKAIAAARKSKLLSQQIEILTEKLALTDNKGGTQDSLTVLYSDKAEHYERQWRECDNDLQVVVKQYKKQRMLTYVASVGAVLTFVLGIFIF